jgi:uncharacterized membrane protein YqjE
MNAPDEQSESLVGSLRRAASTVLAIGENRVELFLVELQEERQQVLSTLLLAAAAVGFLLLALTLLTGTVLLFFWDTHRLAALVGLGGFYTVVGGWFSWRLRVRLQQWESFSATLAELKKDHEWLQRP